MWRCHNGRNLTCFDKRLLTLLFSFLATLLHSTHRCQRSFKKAKKPKFWKCSEKKKFIPSRLILWFPFAIFGTVLHENIFLPEFDSGISEKVFSFFRMWYLIFCWGANRGCGGSRCNKILGIHNNTTKLPTKSQRKPKRWKINWSISASLQKLLCSNSD